MDISNADVIHDREAQKFKVVRDASEAHLRYAVRNGALDFRHTFVPPSWRHEGLGEKIVVAGLAFAREEGKKVIPTCPFVEYVVENSSDYDDLVKRDEG